MSRILVVGAGVVGTAIGRAFATRGHEVRFVDVDARRVAELNDEGHAASDEVDLSGPSTSVFLTLPTPANDRGYDLTALEDGVRAVGVAIRESTSLHTVVVRSTVAPGTCAATIAPLLEGCSGRRINEGFALASSPEFLRKASADADASDPRFTIVGAHDQDTLDRLSTLFGCLGGEIRLFRDTTTVELIKCAHNAWNAAKISFFNQLWFLSQDLGIDGDLVAETIAFTAEASFNPTYGIRGGAALRGTCLAKDLEALVQFARGRGVPVPLLEAVSVVNELVADLEGAPSPTSSTGGGRTRPPRHESSD